MATSLLFRAVLLKLVTLQPNAVNLKIATENTEIPEIAIGWTHVLIFLGDLCGSITSLLHLAEVLLKLKVKKRIERLRKHRANRQTKQTDQ